MSERTLPKPEYFVSKAIDLGALEGKIISPQQVFTAEWVRRKCQYGCGGYGKRLTCPPYSPTPQKTRQMLDEYETAVLIHCSKQTNLRELVVNLEREAFLSGYYRAFAMGSGPCHLCDVCNLQERCKHPRQARPAMEACGIDVYKTARTADFPIDVVEDYDSPQNYYGLLLLD